MVEKRFCLYSVNKNDCVVKKEVDELQASEGTSLADQKHRIDLIRIINSACDNCEFKNKFKPSIIVDASKNIR